MDDDDFEYGSDDAFDLLPPNTLLQLEQQALAATQRPTGPLSRPVSNNNVQNKSVGKPLRQVYQEESFQSDKTLQPLPDQNEQEEYLFEDDEVVDLQQDSYTIQQPSRHVAPATSRFHDPQSATRYVQHDHHMHDAHDVTSIDAGAVELRARLEQLENERIRLQKQVDDAVSQAQSRAGEAAILRQKAEKAEREHQQKMAALQHKHADDAARQKAEIERLKSEREKLTTDKRFLEHDLALEAGKNRNNQRVQKQGQSGSGRPGQTGSPAVTPRKARVLPFRDGFDDGDLVLLSPSKSIDRSKPLTPKGGAKRKRTAADAPSPVPQPQLPLSAPRSPRVDTTAEANSQTTRDILKRLSKEESKVSFIEDILQTIVCEELEENIFEALARFAFPSNPKKRLSRILCDRLAEHPPAADPNFATIADDFCSIILMLWKRCLDEQYQPPLPSLVSSIQSLLEMEGFAFSRKWVTKVVPLTMATADLIAIPAAEASLKIDKAPKDTTSLTTTIALSKKSDRLGKGPSADLEVDTKPDVIDVEACLQLLLTLAEAAAPIDTSIIQFWEQMKFDFVLMMLLKAHPVEQNILMLDVLSSSALSLTFGAILRDADRQAQREQDLLTRLTSLLNEVRNRADLKAPSNFKLENGIIQVLLTLTLTDHGAYLLSVHRTAIGRLFAFLHDSINALYTHTHPIDHDLLINLVNNTTTILYELCSSDSKHPIDIRQKFAVIPGGMQIHLLALTRLAFAERVWYEKGITDGTVERAHEMLDEFLSPEEGESLMMLFGSSEGGSGQAHGEEDAEDG